MFDALGTENKNQFALQSYLKPLFNLVHYLEPFYLYYFLNIVRYFVFTVLQILNFVLFR